MNSWPIIVRELRAEARRPVHYRLRLLAGTAFTTFLAFYALVAAQASAAAVGASVFHEINFNIYLTIWLTAPLLTCDCLSKEKREGTLSLLFLTPLTALGVVIGKSFVHALRALSFLLAAAPVVTVPYLMGGVTWNMVLSILAVELGALALALGAGLLASSGTRLRRWAIFQTVVWTLVFAVVHIVAMRTVLFRGTLNGALILLGFSLLAFGVIVLIAARRVRSSWQDRPLSLRQLWWIRLFCSPLFWRSLFRHSTRRMLDHNPIKWLQYYSTWDRVSKWVWCGLALIFDTRFILNGFHIGRELFVMELVLALGLAYAAAASFRRERANGAFELILVSPLSRGEIVSGRLWALWGQFFPAALSLVLPSLWIVRMMDYSAAGTWLWLHVGLVCSTYWSVPILGLHCALAGGSFPKALLNTCFIGVLVPLFLVNGVSLFFQRPATIEDGCGLAFLYQIVLASILVGRLQHQVVFRESRAGL